MSEFTASNGLIITEQSDGVVIERLGMNGFHRLYGFEVAGLREFFQKENDDRLGRWRWPQNAEFVVYDRGDYVQVIHEATGASGMLGSWTREQADDLTPGSTEFGLAAKAFFDAHPESKPAWHDAKPGEVWEIEVDGRTHHARVGYGDFAHLFEFNEDASMTKRHSAITAGRRIWPEVAS